MLLNEWHKCMYMYHWIYYVYAVILDSKIVANANATLCDLTFSRFSFSVNWDYMNFPTIPLFWSK